MNTRLIACLLTVSLAGCLGSPEPYRPGYQERPIQEKLDELVAEADRLAVPVDILRNDAYLLASHREIERVLGDIPRNPWISYEVDMLATLGPDLAKPYLGGRIPPYLKIGDPED